MPTLLTDIIAALCTEQLVSQFAGVDLFQRGTNTVTGPSTWDRFPTIHDLLNGIGSLPYLDGTPADLAAEDLGSTITEAAANADPTITEAFTAGIDADDRVYIESIVEGFSIKATYGDILGFESTYTASVVVGDRHRVTAPNDYTRGQFLCGNDPGSGLIQYTVKYGAAEQLFTVFPPPGRHAGVLEWVRTQDQSDLLSNAVGTNLSYLDRNAGPHVNTRWFLNDSGKVCNSAPSYVDFVEWLSTDFRDWLGFRGDETPVADGTGHFTLTATDYPQGLIWLDRPIEYFEPAIQAARNVQALSDARFEQAHISTVHGWRLRFAITGLAATVDRLMDAEENFFEYLWRSEYFTVYLNTLEKRMAVREKAGYSIEVTGQDDKRMGAHRLVLDPGIAAAAFDLEDPEIRMRYFLELLGWNYKAA